MKTERKQKAPNTCVERLRLWDSVSVSMPDNTQETCLEARIDEFDADLLYLSGPPGNTGVVYGSRTEVTFVREEGLYKFDAVLDSLVRDQRHCLTLRPTSGVRHVQRRNAVRVDLRLDLELAPIRRPVCNPAHCEDLNWEESQTTNFSSSGALTKVTRHFVIGDLVAIHFLDRPVKEAPALILSSWRRLATIGEVTYMGLQFIHAERLCDFLLVDEIPNLPAELLGMSEGVADMFGKFVFEYELEQRKRGLI